MHEIILNDLKDVRQLTQAVLQIVQMLGMYQAELARILGLQCGDIGAMASASRILQEGSSACEKARRFVTLYEHLYHYCAGDTVSIYHWLRAGHRELGGAPLLLMVDDGRLEDVIAWFDRADVRNVQHGRQIQP